MHSLQQLSENDTLFVAGETRTTYNHTAGLMLLEPCETGVVDFDTFRDKVCPRLDRVPLFRWKLHELPLALDLPYWVEDQHFNYRHHIKHLAVPAPGDIRALSDIASNLFSNHMDRGKPLWEIWFIEGLANGGCAVMLKLHHCMMDGQGAMKLLEILCDLEPDATPAGVPDDIATARPGRTPSLLESSLRTTLKMAGKPAQIGRTLLELATPRLRGALDGTAKDSVDSPPFSVHPVLNADIGTERGFVFGSLQLREIKRISQHFGASVNEVVLALVGTALRTYLSQQGQLAGPALRATMPISLRGKGDEGFANKVTSAVLTLATDIEGPRERLAAIHQESQTVKQVARSGSKGTMEMVQMMPPLFVTVLARSVNPAQAAQIIQANLAVSNVRGSPVPVYLAGARVTALYPMSVITPGMSLNVTCVGYDGRLDFGLTLDPDAFPDAWSLMEHLEAALAEYMALTDPKKKRYTAANPRSNRSTRTRKKKAPAK